MDNCKIKLHIAEDDISLSDIISRMLIFAENIEKQT